MNALVSSKVDYGTGYVTYATGDGDWYDVHATATLGSSVRVGKCSRIGALARIGDEVKIGAFVSIGSRCVVEDGVVIEDDVRIEQNARIQKGAVLRKGAVVKANASVGSDVVIGERAIVGADTNVGMGSSIGPATILFEDMTVPPHVVIGNDGEGWYWREIVGILASVYRTNKRGPIMHFADVTWPLERWRLSLDEFCKQNIKDEELVLHCAKELREFMERSERAIQALE